MSKVISLEDFNRPGTNFIQKAYKSESLQKAGEGSKGGKVIGHTKSGNAIYSEVDADSVKKDAENEQIKRARSVYDHPDTSVENKEKARQFLESKKKKDTSGFKHDKIKKAIDDNFAKGLIDEITYLKASIQFSNLIEKGGEGSRGGKVIGHTKSGKAVYSHKSSGEYADFDKEDHKDAADLHSKAWVKANIDKEKMSGDESMDAHWKQTAKIKHHGNIHAGHTGASMGYVNGKKTLGQTRSGKHVFMNAHDSDHDSFNGEDHTDAANLHSQHTIKHMNSGDNAKSNHHFHQREEHWKKSFDHNSNASWDHAKKEFEKNDK